jgi:RNA polymerase sigma-70 factor (ECF subfamily)
MDAVRLSVNELAKACAHSSDAGEWRDFLRQCSPLASVVALRVARMWTNSATPAMVEDIVQDVFLKLCEQERRILRDFEPRGDDSFFGLLRIVTASVANDYFRRQRSEKRGGKVVTSSLEEDTFPIHASGDGSSEVQRTVFLVQLNQILQSDPRAISERDRSIFWLYYQQGFTAVEIAGMAGLGLTPKGVESALRRITSWAREELGKRRRGEGP